MRILHILAVMGFALSVAVHIASLFGFDSGRIFRPYLLHAGVFLVLAPLALTSRQFPRLNLQAAPKWMKIVTMLLFFYSTFSFIVLRGPYDRDKPPIRHADGHYSVRMHDEGVRNITEEEYHQRKAWLYRQFSEIWMVFYCLSVSVYESRRRVNLVENRHLPSL